MDDGQTVNSQAKPVRVTLMAMKKSTILNILSLVIFLSSMLMGIFAAMGFCVAIWGPSILETALGSRPQHSHPAFITFVLIMVPGMFLSMAGALGVPYMRSSLCIDVKQLRKAAAWILRVTEEH